MEVPSNAISTNEQATSHEENISAHDQSSAEASHASQTATEFINSQLQLEADAREALPYAFDHCTRPLGALRQSIFSCITCNPPPKSRDRPYEPAGLCYSCSIACHGDHTLVELFNRRNFTCDCGTTRLPSTSPCRLRIDPATGTKAPVHSQIAATSNTYNQNFQNRFCGCGEVYDAHEEKGTMFQCLGLATEQEGGCGEDWWHPECVLGLGRGRSHEESRTRSTSNLDDSSPVHDVGESLESVHPLPPGFPPENDFEAFICYKCVSTNQWIKRYAGSAGFLNPVFKHRSTEHSNLTKIHEPSNDPEGSRTRLSEDHHNGEQTLPNHKEDEERLVNTQAPESSNDKRGDFDTTAVNGSESMLVQSASNGAAKSNKRKAEDLFPEHSNSSDTKKVRLEGEPAPYHETLPSAPTNDLSLFCHEDFRDRFCRCPDCYLLLRKHPQLLEEEESYEPPVSETGEEGPQSVGTGSLLDRGEAALSNVDRVKAIEGVMVYNHLKDKVKSFLQPFAESGQAVGAEDIKAYFEKLRGDDQAIKAAGDRPVDSIGDGDGSADSRDRKEQSGY